MYLVAAVYLAQGRLVGPEARCGGVVWWCGVECCRMFSMCSQVRSVVDRRLLLVPGLQSLAALFACSAPSRSFPWSCPHASTLVPLNNLIPGREELGALLAEGHLVGVAPGGGRQVSTPAPPEKGRIPLLLFGYLS